MSEQQEKRNREKPIEFEAGDHREVMITPANRDKFFMTIDKIVDACVAQDQRKGYREWIDSQLHTLEKIVKEWAKRQASVTRILLGKRDGGNKFLLLILTTGKDHDFSLDDAASELDLHIYSQFKVFPVTVFSVPEETPSGVDAFLDRETSAEVYAKSR